jgi:hypothetical protein
MHSRYPAGGSDNAAGQIASQDRPGEGRAGLSSDLGSALVEFARRLANFGLGEAEPPLLDEFVDRRRRPRLTS